MKNQNWIKFQQLIYKIIITFLFKRISNRNDNSVLKMCLKSDAMTLNHSGNDLFFNIFQLQSKVIKYSRFQTKFRSASWKTCEMWMNKFMRWFESVLLGSCSPEEYAFKITNEFAVRAVSTHKHQLNISKQVSNVVESVRDGEMIRGI